MWIRRRHFRQRDLLEVKYSGRVPVFVLLQFNLFFYNLKKKKSTIIVTCFPVVKNLPANAGDARDTGSIPGSGRSPGGGNGNPIQYSCLENSMDRGAWQATVHGVAKSRTWLSAHTTNSFVTDIKSLNVFSHFQVHLGHFQK